MKSSCSFPAGCSCVNPDRSPTACPSDGRLQHLIIDGRTPVTLTLESNQSINLNGVVYLGTKAIMDATKSGLNGRDLSINADGFGLFNGEIVLDGLIDSSGAPGPGQNGGNFQFSTKSSGPLFIPTVKTVGGDRQFEDLPLNLSNGGKGGDVTIYAQPSTDGHVVDIFLGGKNDDPFGASVVCGFSGFLKNNIFSHGILTRGGDAGQAATVRTSEHTFQVGGGGNITIKNETSGGRIVFEVDPDSPPSQSQLRNVKLFTGSGIGNRCQRIQRPSLSGWGN